MRSAVSALLLTAYGGLLGWLTLSPHSVAPLSWENRLQLHPLRTTAEFLAVGGWPMLVNVVGNLGAFMPLGLLWPVVRRGRTSVWRVGCLSAALSLLIETIQYGSGRRIADVDDLLLNTLGGLLGYGLYLVLYRYVPILVVPSSHPDLVTSEGETGSSE
ncbi:VanZ like family protein [Singulisphaera sp. GP187]|uniref:VanZ family protein n=1 Tax=Singulisphaera sp. GP187 TaxID=1882752 RepID=UPI00092C35AB|nr:VanZ family protein [Singulisphaera sp. GP187]SIO58723.1 VanZ like family protein [Singulisphaera sp. GP187]